MHDIVKNGEIGQIHHVNWIITNWFRTQFYYDSGSWRDLERGGQRRRFNQCHTSSIFCNGSAACRQVRAFCHFGKWHDIETEDNVTAYLEFPNRATGRSSPLRRIQAQPFWFRFAREDRV
ncbi:MAG: hypothetical protein ACLRSW_06165 [Christensenellaceae bacterium]